MFSNILNVLLIYKSISLVVVADLPLLNDHIWQSVGMYMDEDVVECRALSHQLV